MKLTSPLVPDFLELGGCLFGKCVDSDFLSFPFSASPKGLSCYGIAKY